MAVWLVFQYISKINISITKPKDLYRERVLVSGQDQSSKQEITRTVLGPGPGPERF